MVKVFLTWPAHRFRQVWPGARDRASRRRCWRWGWCWFGFPDGKRYNSHTQCIQNVVPQLTISRYHTLQQPRWLKLLPSGARGNDGSQCRGQPQTRWSCRQDRSAHSSSNPEIRTLVEKVIIRRFPTVVRAPSARSKPY